MFSTSELLAPTTASQLVTSLLFEVENGLEIQKSKLFFVTAQVRWVPDDDYKPA